MWWFCAVSTATHVGKGQNISITMNSSPKVAMRSFQSAAKAHSSSASTPRSSSTTSVSTLLRGAAKVIR
jgi:hypothetical protein